MRSASGRYWDWPKIIAEARAHPGAWVVRLRDQPARVVRTVNQKQHPALRLPDGRLEAKALHSYQSDRGGRRADVYIRFVNEGPGSLGPRDPGPTHPEKEDS